MAYTEKFQSLADAAMSRVTGVPSQQVDPLLAAGAVALDIRDKEEHEADHIAGSVHVSRGKLEMNIEAVVTDLDVVISSCSSTNGTSASTPSAMPTNMASARVRRSSPSLSTFSPCDLSTGR